MSAAVEQPRWGSLMLAPIMSLSEQKHPVESHAHTLWERCWPLVPRYIALQCSFPSHTTCKVTCVGELKGSTRSSNHII